MTGGWFHAFAFVGASYCLLRWIATRKPSDVRHITTQPASASAGWVAPTDNSKGKP